MTHFIIPTNKGLKAVLPENIIRIEACSNYCKIYFANEYPLTVAKVLHWFEQKLSCGNFYRIHRGHIVNRKFISTISCNKTLTLCNGERLQVSKRKRYVIQQILE
jgi:two-component system LytT family response regulator